MSVYDEQFMLKLSCNDQILIVLREAQKTVDSEYMDDDDFLGLTLYDLSKVIECFEICNDVVHKNLMLLVKKGSVMLQIHDSVKYYKIQPSKN
jgi:hypothetical protein